MEPFVTIVVIIPLHLCVRLARIATTIIRDYNTPTNGYMPKKIQHVASEEEKKILAWWQIEGSKAVIPMRMRFFHTSTLHMRAFPETAFLANFLPRPPTIR